VLATGKKNIAMIGLSFKTGTDDLRESPMVALAEQLIGKGLSLLIYDPDVHLSRLLGANKRFIETRLPHIGNLLRADLASVVGSCDVLIVGTTDKDALAQLRRLAQPHHHVLDLARVQNAADWPCPVEGLCW
jgi:GDP-mannose 6-dehydrogenase